MRKHQDLNIPEISLIKLFIKRVFEKPDLKLTYIIYEKLSFRINALQTYCHFKDTMIRVSKRVPIAYSSYM